MFMFVDGRPVVLSFALVESLYYKAFMERFPDAGVSITQWRGSYEYQAIYPDIQMIVETGVITRDAMAFIGQSIVQANETIKRPACLYSRVPERFKELGYDASIRIATEATKGTVAICVDQERVAAPDRVMVVGALASDPDVFGYEEGGYGYLDAKEYGESRIVRINTVSDGSDNVYITFADSVTAPDPDGVSLKISMPEFSGSPAVFTDTGFGTSWQCVNAGLAPFIKGKNGSTVLFSIENDPTNYAVNDDDAVIGNLIRDEMLPGGQWMEGPVAYETALSNTQPITIRWATPTDWELQFRLTIVRRKGSPYPENTVDEIIEKFMTNFNAAKGVGRDVYPQTYLTTHDLPWAASILAEWTDSGESEWWDDDIVSAYDTRYGASVQPARVVIQ